MCYKSAKEQQHAGLSEGAKISFQSKFTKFVTIPRKERREKLNKQLRQAIYDQDAGAVKTALKLGARTEDSDYTGFTMLHLAAVRASTEVVETLIAGGADINARTARGMTAVHLAARSGWPEVIKTLAKHGADLKALDDDQATPLYIAMQHCQPSSTVALLNLGIRPDMDRISKVTPVESEGEIAWHQTKHALHSTLGLIRANRLKHLRMQMNRRASGAATP